MDKSMFLKNKNFILNLTVIITALFVALQIYSSDNQQVKSLNQKKEDELKKNEIIQGIVGLEKKIDDFKQVFPKKDSSSIMTQISNIAKNNLIKIVSIKPVDEQVFPDYIKTSFLINVYVPDYHALGNFISQLENNKEIFTVGEISIVSANIKLEDKVSNGLDVRLNIGAVSFI